MLKLAKWRWNGSVKIKEEKCYLLRLYACVCAYVYLCVCVSINMQVHPYIWVCVLQFSFPWAYGGLLGHFCVLGFVFGFFGWWFWVWVFGLVWFFCHAPNSFKTLEQPEIKLLLAKEKQNTSQAHGTARAPGSWCTQQKETPLVWIWLRMGEHQGCQSLQILGSQFQPQDETHRNQSLEFHSLPEIP